MPAINSEGGGYVRTIDAGERRRLAAEMRSTGASYKRIADEYYRGNVGNAWAAIKQFWDEQPKATVEEIRSTMLAKLDGLEREVREVMARRHYVVDRGVIVRNHGDECDREQDEEGRWVGRCRCPKLEDDKPIYEGVDRVRNLVETQLKLIPGLAASTRTEVTGTQTVEYKINATPDELDKL